MKKTEVFNIIHSLYDPGSVPHYYLICHGEAVARKALEIAVRPCLASEEIDRDFLYTASMLHDIGMIFTNAPEVECSGGAPYLLHGILGAEYLREMGLEEYARVAERHLNLGVTREDIRRENLPFPDRDMMPETLEEKIICFADKFHSKVPKSLTIPKPVDVIVGKLPEYARKRFFDMAEAFDEPGVPV